MYCLKFSLISFVAVHALTLNERGMAGTFSEASSRNKLQTGHLNIEQALTQLRAAVEKEKLASTQDTARLNHLLENSSYAEADAIKSLIFSSVSQKAIGAENNAKSMPKSLKNSKTSSSKASRKDGQSAWGQSGGGCHSAIGQEGFGSAFSMGVKALVKKIAQGRQFTEEDLGGATFAAYHTTSSGGSWMWASFIAATHSTNQKFQKKRVGWTDAVVVPNVDRANWKKAMQHARKGEDTAMMKSVGDEGMETYEAMIENSVRFFLKVKKDPSLAHVPMRDVVKADLATQALQGDAEVRKIAAQYGVDTTQSGLLSTIKKVTKEMSQVGVKSKLTRGVRGLSKSCDTSADWPTCTPEELMEMFGASYVCIKPLVTGALESAIGGWTETVWTKFLKPFGVAHGATFGDIGYDAPETWKITTASQLKTPVLAYFGDGELATSTTKITKEVSASSNFGLSVYYLLYYSKSSQGFGCGPNVAGAVTFFQEKGLGKKYANEVAEFTSEFLASPAGKMTETALEIAADLSAVAQGTLAVSDILMSVGMRWRTAPYLLMD
jgi:hypothetical protein